jgi:NADH-quinone oxidoreductase subunit L
MGVLVDPISVLLMVVVTTVSALVHLYSIGYMHGDEGYYRFFAYLNLFMFAMFVLILASSYFLLFLGWEGVGLCSGEESQRSPSAQPGSSSTEGVLFP